jgi:PAS domain S-box-containing protein
VSEVIDTRLNLLRQHIQETLAQLPVENRQSFACKFDALLFSLADDLNGLEHSYSAKQHQTQHSIQTQGDQPNGSILYDSHDRTSMQEALHSSENVLRQLAENINQTFWLRDAKTNQILYVSPAYEKMWGRTCESLYQNPQSFLNSIHPDDVAEVAQGQANLRETGQMFNMEFRIVHPDGSVHWVKSATYPIHDPSGVIIRYAGTAEDVTERKEVEAALRQKTEELEGFFSLALDLLCIADTRGCFLRLNKSWEDILGYTTADLEGRRFLDFVHPDDLDATLAVMRDLDRQKNIIDFTNRYRSADGSYRTIEWRSHPHGSTIYAAARDITDRKRMEESLRETNQYLENLINYANAPIIVWNPSYQITRFNRAAEKVTGRCAEEVIGKSIEILFPPYQVDNTLQLIQKTAAGERQNSVELALVRPDGDVRTVLWNSVTIYEDDMTTPVAVIAQGQDITVRKRAEEALIVSERKFRSLFENMAEGMALHELVYDEQGKAIDYRLLQVNPAYEKHTNLLAEETYGALASQLYKTNQPPFLSEYESVANSGQPISFETYFSPLQKHFRISVISHQKGQFATVFDDITERKQKEEEIQQKNEELARFSYTVSHDLKSPLVTIKAFLGFLEKDIIEQDSDRIAKDLAHLHGATTRMTRLLDDLLHLSQVGHKVNKFVEVPLQEIVTEALEQVAGQIMNGNIEVRLAPARAFLYCDRQRMVEVFQNLIDNASKFMGNQPKPLIEIGMEQEVDEQIVYYVRDNGKGIDPRHMDRLFGLFEKLDPNSEGTGIGLALVKRIIEVHGGKISAHSNGVNQGTTFKFTLAKSRLA